MKKVHLLWLLLLIHCWAFSQKYKPTDFYGTLKFIDEKSVDFTYLSDSTGKTQILFLKNSSSDFGSHSNQKTDLLPLQWIDRIEIIRTEGKGEGQEFQAGHTRVNNFQEVKITYNENPGAFPDTVFLAITGFTWKNEEIKGFSKDMFASLRYLDSITIHVKKDRK